MISLPALAAEAAGPASLVAWAALLLISVAFAASFTALGARFPDGGGVTTYVRRAFGDRASTAVGWAFYLTIPVGAPTAAGFAAHYVADALGRGRGTALLVAALILLVVTAVNWFGIEASARSQLVIAAVLAVLLVLVIVLALPHSRSANLTPFAPHGVGGVAQAAGILLWAFVGWEIMASLSGRYHTPGRDIARAAGIALVVVSVLYVGIAFCTVAVLGPDPGSGAALGPAGHRAGRAGATGDDGARRAADRGHHQHVLRRRGRAGCLAGPRRVAARLARGPVGTRRRAAPRARAGGGARPAHDRGDGRPREGHRQRAAAHHGDLRARLPGQHGRGGPAARRLGRSAAVVSVVASGGLVAVTGWRVLFPVAVGLLGVWWARRR